MGGIAPPEYTMIPNEILDQMHLMTEPELRVLLAVCRQTFGWQRRDDILSLTQLMRLTGLSKTAMIYGIAAAIDRGLLQRVQVGKQAFSYRLLFKMPESTGLSPPQPVNDVDRSTTLTSQRRVPVNDVYRLEATGQRRVPDPVNVVDRQTAKPVNDVDPPPLKKDLKKLKEKAAAAAAVFGAIISPTDALRLVETHPECIDHAEALVREASKPKINDPAGMLVHLVTTGWIPPAVNGNGHGPVDEEDMSGYLSGYCATCAQVTFGSCGHDEQPQASSRPRRRGRQPA